MRSKDVMSFDEALESANEFGKLYPECSDKNVLLGNGFSIACCPEIFTYDSLFKSSNFSECIKKVFQEFKTNDFEKIIKKLNETLKICQIYNVKQSSIKQIYFDSEKIKKELVDVISNKHPEHQHRIKNYKYCSAFKFISNFNNIFTLNYDMLLYWILMFKERDAKILEQLNITLKDYADGFGRRYKNAPLNWYKNSLQNVFYLHGALHLFDDNLDIIKAETTDEFNLMESIKDRLNEETYPLIVTEGTSNEKLEKISHNKYLQNSYDKLNEISGTIFIHGHSLDKNDKHIFNQIKYNSYIKRVYISIFKPQNNIEEIKDKAFTLLINKREEKPKELFYYDAESAHAWDSISEEEEIAAEFDLYEENNEF